MGHEVVTLQFGSFANYVGAHYWNFQDELLGLQEQEETAQQASQVDCGVLFRQGETAQGRPTYSPRLVLFDLSGSLGATSVQGSLYHDAAPPVVSTWQGQHEVHRAAPVDRSTFSQQLLLEDEGEQAEHLGHKHEAARAGGEAGRSPLETAARQLDGPGGVRFFTDYLKAHLHPRSICQLQGLWQGVTPFDGWGDGAAYVASSEHREGMLERVRFFAEEADSLQGIQCWVDDLSGFGHVAATLLPELHEDLGSSLPVMLYAVRTSQQEPAGLEPAAVRRRRLGQAFSLAWLTQHCSTYTLLVPPANTSALPLLRWRPNDAYHAAAICAAALDTATLPYRLSLTESSSGPIGGVDMWALTQLLTSQYSTPLSALGLALPCPSLPEDLQRQAQQADTRVEHHAEEEPAGGSQEPFTLLHTASLTPGIPVADEGKYVESVVLRGPRSEARAPVQLPAAGAELDHALLQERQRCVRQRTLLAQALPLPLPYPHIFSPRVLPWGDVLPAGMPSSRGRQLQDVLSCPVLTRLSGTAAFTRVLQDTSQQFSSLAASGQGLAILQGWGFVREECSEVEERLQELEHAYEEED